MNLLKMQYILFLVFSLISASCGKSGERRELDRREKEINMKEQQLLTREQQLNQKEAELLKRERQLDSLKNGSDTTGVYNPALVGSWTVTMQCTETSCEGSAIGDTKTEQWQISYQNTKVTAAVTVNKKLIRTYTGIFKENSLLLSATQHPETDTHMDVTLTPHPETAGLMEGQRIINQGGKCRIVYAIKAEKR